MKERMKKLWRDHGALLLAGVAVMLVHVAVGVVYWDRLPERIATHFDFHNEPDGWTGKAFTVFGMPLILLALHGLCLVVSSLPGHALGNVSVKVQRMVYAIIPATSLLMTVTVYGYALGATLDIGRIVWVFLGVVFAATGNYLPKMRRSRVMGIKLPWTLADEDNWNRTHRMAGPVWVVCGAFLIVCGLAGCFSPFLPAAVIAAAVVVPTAYSLALHLKKKNR